MTPIRITLLSGVMLLSGGCFIGKKPQVKAPVTVPPPVASTPSPEPEPAPEPAPAVSSTPPQTQPSLPEPIQPPPIPIPQPAETTKPSPFPPVARPTPPRPTPITPPPATVTPPPTPAPALGAMLTPELRRQLDATYVSDLNRANEILGRLSGKTLTAEQKDSVSRAKAWIRQAADYHNKDLATAAELARRARLLTQDLASAFK